MGWGTTFKTDIYLNKTSFSSKIELDDTIKDLEKSIERYKQEIAMYTTSTPSSITPDEWKDDSITFLYNKLRDLLELYEEDLIRLHRFYLLQDYLEENPEVEVSKLKD